MKDFISSGKRVSYGKIPEVLEVPNLLQIQLNSYRWFLEEGLKELFEEISPIVDYTGNRYELHFVSYRLDKPRFSEDECREKGITYAAPLRVRARLIIKETGEVKEQELYFGDLPLMTRNGTLLINEAERAVVNQLIRSPGVYFLIEEGALRKYCTAKLIPERGVWLEFEVGARDQLVVKADSAKKIPVTTLLCALGCGGGEKLIELFSDVDTNPDHPYIKSTLELEPSVLTRDEALLSIHRRLKPGGPHTVPDAEAFLHSLLFDSKRYNLGRVGRYKLNKRLGVNVPMDVLHLTADDLIAIVRHLILVNEGKEPPDDIDHLRNRRVRSVGELLQNQMRIGLLRLERLVKERMSLVPPENATPGALVNNRPVVAVIREFFGTSPLSQYLDQTNPLSELTHKRRLSTFGPGGLSRERAGFKVRDVHHSHYGRICPIETPEGPNIGLITSLAVYARVNDLGFIETPYRKVKKEVPNKFEELVGREAWEEIRDEKGEVIVRAGERISEEAARRISELPIHAVKVRPFVTSEIEYLDADREEEFVIAQANAGVNEKNEFIDDKVAARKRGEPTLADLQEIDYMDVSPKQIVSVSASLIPFLEHDDANRALMGSNMQRQAVPLIRPQAPLIATGMEKEVAKYSGYVLYSPCDGEVTSVTAREIKIKGDDGKEYVLPLVKFGHSNQGTCVNQRPVVNKGQRVKKGDLLADCSTSENGELALGQNVLVAFLSWEGYNFEDAILASEDLLRDNRFTSIHLEDYEVEVRETKLGPEELTADIPDVKEESLRNLDENGIVRIGAYVKEGDILVGKVTPRGERELTPEEKLLHMIFGEKAHDVRDTSLRVPHGEYGRVIGVNVLTKDKDQLPPGVLQKVKVYVAQRRNLTAGDKLTGRHGNKGVISKILPREDMPFLPDGRPVEMVFSLLGVPSRMNVGQLLETHLGWAAHTLGFKVLCPVFDGADIPSIQDALGMAWLAYRAGAVKLDEKNQPHVDKERLRSWLEEQGYEFDKVFDKENKGYAKLVCLRLWLKDQGIDASDWSEEEVEREIERLYKEKGLIAPIFGKMTLYDGRTGEPFENPVTVGYMYILKLVHLAEDKTHARSIGPYSIITQQPLGGKAQFGGQRFGEMEVWALEAYGAAHTLQEMLTIKSDDVEGRNKAYLAIVEGRDVPECGIPESFKVLVKELQSLGLAVELIGGEPEGRKLPAPPRELESDKSITGGSEER